MNITVGQLRKLLFEIDNQDMTVREMRQKLFVQNQNTQLSLLDQLALWKIFNENGEYNWGMED